MDGSWAAELLWPAEAKFSKERTAEKTAKVFILKEITHKQSSTRPVAVKKSLGGKEAKKNNGKVVDEKFVKKSSIHHFPINTIAVLKQLPSKKLTLL